MSREQAGHCEVLWLTTQGVRARCIPRLTYPDTIDQDNGLRVNEHPAAMRDRTVWKYYYFPPFYADCAIYHCAQILLRFNHKALICTISTLVEDGLWHFS